MLTLHLDTCAQVRSEKKIPIFLGSGASALTHEIPALPCLWNKPISVWGSLKVSFTNCRNNYNEFLQDTRRCIKNEALLRSQADTRSRVRLVEPKTLMPDRFGKKNGLSWRTWSYLARDFVGVVHATLKQAMKAAENQKQLISVTHLQHEFNVTNEMDQELQHFLISWTEGEALEIVRGAEREPGLEQWRSLAALHDSSAAGRSLDDRRQILSPPKAAQNRRPLAHHPSLGKS